MAIGNLVKIFFCNFAKGKKSYMKIRNIIFDLGNVIVKLDEQATINAFGDLGVDCHGHIRNHQELNHLFQLMEVGKITNEVFFDIFRRIAKHSVTDKQITDATNAMLIEIPTDKKNNLLRLKQNGVRTFLLSNTMDLHWHYCTKMLFPMGSYSVMDYFDNIFVSHEMHMKKPDDILFKTVIDGAFIDPNETLFIDDLEENCLAAQKNGIHAFQNKNFYDWDNTINQLLFY